MDPSEYWRNIFGLMIKMDKSSIHPAICCTLVLWILAAKSRCNLSTPISSLTFSLLLNAFEICTNAFKETRTASRQDLLDAETASLATLHTIAVKRWCRKRFSAKVSCKKRDYKVKSLWKRLDPGVRKHVHSSPNHYMHIVSILS